MKTAFSNPTAKSTKASGVQLTQVRPADAAYNHNPAPAPYRLKRLVRAAQFDANDCVAFEATVTLDELIETAGCLFLLDTRTNAGTFAGPLDSLAHQNSVLYAYRDTEGAHEEFETFTDRVQAHAKRLAAQ